MNENSSKKMAYCGVFVALSMILSYFENLVVIFNFIPGFKVGIANIVTVIALFNLGIKDTFIISTSRIILSGILFGSVPMIIYSIVGAYCSILVMYVIKKINCFSITGVSILGAVSHNAGQLVVAYFMLENVNIFSYFGVLALVGALAGTLIGILCGYINKNIDFK
ncbi:MAG: Gx transporter family protein [Lachnospiraceae bacterium]|nr:Gx transporter family protein [Lachnospiraceae bacterium]